MTWIALLLAQEALTVPFADPHRAEYVEAIQSCRAAQEKIPIDPEAAERELTAVLKTHPDLALERRVTVYERPNDPKTYTLCPWQYRGQVRLALSRRPGAVEAEKQRRLREAVEDLEKSVVRKNAASEPLLREAVARLTAQDDAAVPRLPLFRSEGRSIAADVDRALDGFGLR